MFDCKLNDIFRGEVSSVQNYGAFVKIPNCPQQGLVHKTQISSSHVDDLNEILQKGDKIWCKVISINDDGKIALSMKYVNQGSGKDLDANNVQLHLDNQKRKAFGKREDRKAIVLDAVYKTTCSKCKTPGHLAKDCFSTPDGKRYELLPDVDDEIIPVPQTQSIDNEKKIKDKKHKSKKSKKRKKSKSANKDSTDDEEENVFSDKKKKKKKSSKESKHKKRKKHTSSSDSDSTDDESESSLEKKRSKKCKRSKEKHEN